MGINKTLMFSSNIGANDLICSTRLFWIDYCYLFSMACEGGRCDSMLLTHPSSTVRKCTYMYVRFICNALKLSGHHLYHQV